MVNIKMLKDSLKKYFISILMLIQTNKKVAINGNVQRKLT